MLGVVLGLLLGQQISHLHLSDTFYMLSLGAGYDWHHMCYAPPFEQVTVFVCPCVAVVYGQVCTFTVLAATALNMAGR